MSDPIEDINISQEECKKVLGYIDRIKGVDLSSYRLNFVYRRLRLRMSAIKVESCSDYITFLKNHPAELDKFFDSLSINVTEFFRDPEVFETVKDILLPEIMRKKEGADSRFIRVWSAGCATGQEVYSLAILIKEKLERKSNFLVKILGTDVDADALQKSEKGEYHTSQFRKVDKEILEKYFIADYNDICIARPVLKRMVEFKQHNLITDPPMRGMDLVFCRNVMIYLTRDQQNLLFNKFYHSLNRDGYLVIGQVETIWDRDLFVPVDIRKRIYKKQPN